MSKREIDEDATRLFAEGELKKRVGLAIVELCKFYVGQNSIRTAAVKTLSFCITTLWPAMPKSGAWTSEDPKSHVGQPSRRELKIVVEEALELSLKNIEEHEEKHT